MAKKKKSLKELMETEALVCVNRCTELEKKADKELKRLMKLKKTGKISKKQYERRAEELLILTRDLRNRIYG